MVTGEGISRFDGASFTSYSTDDGLPDRRARDVLETRRGALWVATESGLARLAGGVGDRSPGRPFVPVRPERGTGPIAFTVLHEADDGVVWCGTKGGVYRMDAPGRENPPLRFVDLGIGPDASVTALLQDRRGLLWIGASDGSLHSLAPDGLRAHYSDRNGLSRHELVTSLLETSDGHLWVGTKVGLHRLVDGPDPARSIVARSYTSRDGLASSWVMALHQGRDGRLWVATNAGLCLLDPEADDGSAAARAYRSRNGLCDQDTFHVSEDRDGSLWVASRCGATRVARNGLIGYGTDDGLTTGNISSLLEDRDGGLIAVEHGGIIGAGSYGRRLHRFDGSRFTPVTPRLASEVTYQGWGWGQTVVQRRNGEWWVPTGAGLYRFRAVGRLEELERVRPRLLAGLGRPPPEIFRLYEDRRGIVWIATTGTRYGLWVWDEATDAVRDVTRETGVPPGTDFAAFLEDRAGNLWIGTSDEGGLLRYASGRFERFSTGAGVPLGWILSLHQDRAGRLWLASALGGLGRIDDPEARAPRARTYTTADGLASNGVRSVTSDESGRVYAGTGRGVDRLDPETGRVRRYTHADGLPRGSIEVAHRDREGALWFGSPFGLSRLVPGKPEPSAPPSVVITALRIAGVGQKLPELGAAELPALALASDQSNVSIAVVGLGPSPGEELRYQFRLEGAERDFSPPTADRTIHYARLAPGRYRFQARARSADGLVSLAPATFSFTVAAPLFQRWWFWAALAASAAAAGAALARSRARRLLEMAAIRARIAGDLHDDIGANLTRIAVLSDVLRQREGDLDPESDQPLASISRIARESVSSMGDIVWAIDPRRDSLLDLVRRMRRHAEDVIARDAVLTIETPDAERNPTLGSAIRRDVLLVFKEAISNATRHARAGRVAVALHLDGSALSLSVADDGVGFDTSSVQDGQGLASMRRRAASLGGTLLVESGPSRGTRISLTVPL